MVDLSDLIQNEGPLPSNSSSIKDLLPTSFIGEDSDMETFNAEFDVEESDDEFHNSDGSDTMSGVQDDAQELEVDQSENLVTFIQSLDKKTKKRKHREEVTEAFEESEFALPSRLVHKKASNKLELQDMLNPVTESTSFGTLKKQMRDLEHSKDSLKAEESLAAPLPKRIQDRIHRQAAYEETSKDVSKWTPMIKKNREADHLSFPLNQEPVRNMSNGAMVGQFEVRNADFMQLMEMSNPRQASTDMEKEIQALLREAALTEKKLHESEELEFKKISKEELLERQTELGKMRALLFFKEQKQKKIAKIKSKVYRKLHKKAKESSDLDLEELKRLDPELAKQKLEELEAERARERVTLKHKNTGKWAKQMLNRKDGDIETRCAISTQLEKHQQLKKKITGIDSDASDNEAVDEDGMIQLDRLEKELDVEPEPTTGLMGMKFMKRAMDKEKSESKSLIRSTRSLLEGDDYLESDVEGDQVIAVNPGRKTITTEDSMENMSSDDEGDMSFVHDGPLSVKSTGPIVVQNSKYTAPLFPVESFGIQEQQPESVPVNANLHARTSEKQAITKDDSETGEAVNPWLNNDDSSVAVERSLKSQNLKHSRGQEKSMNKFKKSKKGLLEEGHVEDDDETTLIQDNLFTPAQANTEEPTPSFVTADTLLSSSDDDSDLDISKPKTDMINVADITKMSQADIMRLTFENDDVAEVSQVIADYNAHQ